MSKTPSTKVRGKGMQDTVALKFAKHYAESFRYVAVWNRWYEWDGARWRRETTLNAFDKARGLLRQSDDGAAKADAKVVAAVVTLARADRLIAATHDQWDRDSWLLGTPGGTVDLRTNEMCAARPDDYITKITAVTPDRNCPIPLWTKFLKRITNNKKELQNYLQRVSGYGLTGDTSEEALFFSYGTGGNGKGTFWETVSGIMGDYHTPATMGMFTATKQERHSTETASLHGARLVTATETEEGRRWDENKIKALTGGGPISAHFMHQDPFAFVPQFKLAIDGNHKPRIRTVDEAIRRRMNLIPFMVTISEAEKDRKLKLKLRREWPGILAWMIDGCLMWQRDGLNPPDVVTQATENYLASEDTLQNWLNECCETGDKNMKASAVSTWVSWKHWAANAHEYIGSQKELSQKLSDKFEPYKSMGRMGFRGLRVLDVD